MSILLIDFNDITIEQLLSQLNPVIELGGERAELACRYDERQGWVVGYVVADVAKWAKLPGGSRFFCRKRPQESSMASEAWYRRFGA